MANWFCSVFNVVCVANVCRSELMDSAWVVIAPGQKCIKKIPSYFNVYIYIVVVNHKLLVCHIFGLIFLSSL